MSVVWPYAGQGVEPGRVQVGEQRRGPAAAVEPDQHPAVVADQRPQLGDQPAQLRRPGTKSGTATALSLPASIQGPRPRATTPRVSTCGSWNTRWRPAIPTRPTRERTYRLITTITDPGAAPAAELAQLYTQRWEIETAFDELKTHQRGPGWCCDPRCPTA